MNNLQTPVLALLRRLEAQNVWRMTYNVMSPQTFSTAAAMPLASDETTISMGEYNEICASSAIHNFFLISFRVAIFENQQRAAPTAESGTKTPASQHRKLSNSSSHASESKAQSSNATSNISTSGVRAPKSWKKHSVSPD